MAGAYLRPHCTRTWNDPQMPLIFMTGPLVGTAAPTSGRLCVMSRSPLTGTVSDSSVGGSLATQIKRSGLDGLVITGKSEALCGLEIRDGETAFIQAEHWAGMETSLLYNQLKDKGAVAVVGPAAEKGVLFSSLMVDGRFAAGRGGLGLCMAAKNLKYLSVKGSGSVSTYDQEELKKAKADIKRLVAASPVLMGDHGIRNYGTGALFDLMDSRCMMPTANFRRTRFELASSMNAPTFRQNYGFRRTGCKGCHIQCKKKGNDGSDIPEFETMSHFSALIENKDLDIVRLANTRCNEVGLDTISAGGTLACYSELMGKALTGDQVLEILDNIGYGQGVGQELGLGSARYAATMDKPYTSMSVKKLELPAYDPRGAYGMALAYATSTRGGCHLRAYPVSHEILRKPVATDRFSFAGKARIIKLAEDANAAVDSLTACKFLFFAASLEEYAKALSAVTGHSITAQDLMRLGERITLQERLMNSQNGFSASDDDLPQRFFNQPGSTCFGIEIPPLNQEDFIQALFRYYRVRRLDEKGRPLPEKLHELGLL